MNAKFLAARFDLIAIGCSAGGFDLLNDLLPRLPADFPAAIAVVIHIAPASRNGIVEVLAPKCRLPLKEAEDKELVRPATIYFAPPGYHLLVEPDRRFTLSVDEPVNYSRPSIDVLFESAAIAYRERLLGILLSGANSDGAAGLQSIRNLKGKIFVQDPKEATHPEMPRAALDLGPADAVVSLEDLYRFVGGSALG
ncbi:MAG: chemotaxis protein CheB [Bdellovibrionales bacterium]|nr:chemotaxis protein CheB [Bdellovibrionales bacterium]